MGRTQRNVRPGRSSLVYSVPEAPLMAAPTLTPTRPKSRARRAGEVPRQRTYTFDELFAMEDEGIAFELDAEGHLEERPMGALSSYVGGRTLVKITLWSDEGDRGAVFPADISLALWPQTPKMLRRSDVCFISQDRLPSGEIPSGVLRVAPELVVEVVSPHDIAEVLERKIAEYFGGGVHLVWVIYPEQRRAIVRRSNGTASVVGAEGLLEGEDVLPGFSVRLADLLPKK